MLTPGDTISSSFLGFDPTFVVYDDAVQAVRAVTLVHLKERLYEIEDVFVIGQMNAWEAFRRFVRPRRRVEGNYRLNGNFAVRIRMPDNTIRQVTGSFLQSQGTYMGDIDSVLVEFPVIQGDTTKVSEKIRQGVGYSALMANGFFVRARGTAATRPYQTMTYLGVADGIRNFVYTNAHPMLGGGTNQFIVNVDAESREIKSMYLTSTAETRAEAEIHSIAMEFPSYRGRGRVIASKIEIDFREVDGIQMELKLTDLTID